MAARFSTRGGNVNSRRNASRKAWLDGIASKASSGMVTIQLDDGRKGGIDSESFMREMERRNCGVTKHNGKHHVVSLTKAKAA
mgnify:CR=1 FL=1